MQGQFFCESKEGLAFADRGFCSEFKNCGANAKPLQVLSNLLDSQNSDDIEMLLRSQGRAEL